MNAIETENLTRRYGLKQTAAVDGLTLQVPEGAIYAFLGPNGAGKTTTIQTLLNLQRPTSGIARVLGVLSTEIGPKELEKIGYVSENQKLPEGMTVARFLAWCRPLYPTWDPVFAEHLRARFELPLDRKLKDLSRGMKMKAALLASIAYRPRLLILDEPFSGLDPLMRDEFIRGVLELSEQEKWTVFVSSHDIDEVERLADWVGVLNAGKLHLSETTESLQKRFRLVEFAVKEENRKLPVGLPAEWHAPGVAGHVVRFVTGNYEKGATEAKAKELFPDATDPIAHPMLLREIFVTLARAFRITSTSI